VCAGAVGAQTNDVPEVARAQAEVQKLRAQVEAGVAPRAQLEKAEEAMADAQDAAILRRTLYGQDLTAEQTGEMMAAAGRRFDRRVKALDEAKRLVEAGADWGLASGPAAGWEAAVVDHHRAVLNALAAKVVGGSHVSRASDEIGGTTVSFDLWTGHPLETEVRRLLATVRNQVVPLWEKVEAYNREHPNDPQCKVTFYCGQHVTQEDGET